MTKTKKKAEPSPTEAEMTETVRAFVKAHHPDAKDVQLSLWNSGGYADLDYPILTPPKGWKSPDPLPKSVRDGIDRKCAEAKLLSGYFRDRFNKLWAEALADLSAYADQLRRVGELIGTHPFTETGIDRDRVHNAAVELDELVTSMLSPVIRTKRYVADLAAGLEPKETDDAPKNPNRPKPRREHKART